jgi:3-dehydrosphinganine reductase
MKNFENKLALITGGSSGIGLALAKMLSSRGANVYLLARRPDVLHSALIEVENAACSTNQHFGTLTVDVADLEQVNEEMAAFVEQTGVPDLLINSAGVTQPGQFEEQDPTLFRWIMDINILGMMYISRALLPGMLERRSGVIVNISSLAGFLGAYGYVAYGASKFAVRGFSDALRAEMKPRGIQVSVVFPPDTQTPQLEGEAPYKPAVTQALSDNAGVLSAESVAETILKGISRRKYIIIPGFESKLFYFINSLPGNLAYPIMDIMIAQALRKLEKQQK